MGYIDRSSPIPLYYQLKKILLDTIEKGEWAPGALIPSEKELETTYGLSRTTVRQTLAELVTDGFLVRHRGRGTFVAQPKLTYNAASGIEVNDEMREQGFALGWRLLDSQWVPAPIFAAQALNIPTNSRVFCIRRLRLAGGELIGYHIAYLPERWAQSINVERLADGDSFAYLRHLLPAKNPRIERTLEARLAGELEVELIELSAGAPILHLERVVFSEGNEPVEYLKAAFCGDRLKYRITM